ncbi:neugrin [Rhinichthys klamathensis goyatoka]|uniref:neugrin n=1 Tax=Rhinichthys klamathensis goyatoka TaxID=3034132 RepID=UPI0024B4ED02|nr:neugrin [Rhinichthys klamathensis goyatoka]
MVTPWRMAYMLATKLAPFPGPVCRHASRGAYRGMSPRYSDSHSKQKQQEDMFEDDHDMDAVEAKLNSIISEEKRKHKAAKFHIIKRQMNNPGDPERKLTWDAIEQIRYLKQESPEEWTLQRLAEGFSVSPDVISKVLRSKFTPTVVRKLKQDSKVLVSTGQQSLRDGKTEQSRLPKSATPAILSSGKTGALTTLSKTALAVREGETGLTPSGGNVVPSQVLSAVHKLTPALQEQPDSTAKMDMRDDIELEEEEEEWDGVILTEEELEHIAQTLQKTPSSVKQKGSDFFDKEGNFLYRI